MRINVISVGKLKSLYLKEGQAEYVKRLKADADVSVIELDAQHSKANSEVEIRKKEAELLLPKLPGDSFVIALDERGRAHDSRQFAELLQKRFNAGVSTLTFLIGGAYGLDPQVKERAHYVLSLSPMTFTYQMTRVILLEQLYRALSIIKGKPYHK